MGVASRLDQPGLKAQGQACVVAMWWHCVVAPDVHPDFFLFASRTQMHDQPPQETSEIPNEHANTGTTSCRHWSKSYLRFRRC